MACLASLCTGSRGIVFSTQCWLAVGHYVAHRLLFGWMRASAAYLLEGILSRKLGDRQPSDSISLLPALSRSGAAGLDMRAICYNLMLFRRNYSEDGITQNRESPANGLRETLGKKLE